MPFGLFTDAGLVTPLSGNLLFSGALQERELWLGSIDEDVRAVNAAGGNISISLTDTLPGTAPATSIVKLATTNTNWGGVTGGAALTVGSQVLGGAGNAFHFYIQVTNPLTGTSNDTTLGLSTGTLREEVVP